MSIGDTLAEARRQSGLTVTQVSERTRIRETIIRGIEQNDFSACGGDFYARGHIRSIASVVGLDPEPLIQEYDQAHGGAPQPTRAADVFEPAAPLRIKERRSLNWSVAMILALLVVVGYGVYHFVSAGSGSSGTPAAAIAPRATATHSAAPKPAAPSPTPTVSAPSDVVIQLSAVEDCWVFLTNDKGDTIYSGVVPAGSTQSWKETQAVNLRLGNPSGVDLTINGKKQSTGADQQPVTLSVGPAQKVQISPSPAGSAGLASGAQG